MFKLHSQKFNTDLALWGSRRLAAADRVVRRTTFRISNQAVKLITSGSKTGRVYKRRSVTHQSSAVGEAPASDKGGLLRSKFVKFNSRLSGETGFAVQYAKFLEDKGRPFLSTAVKQNEARFLNDMNRVFGGTS